MRKKGTGILLIFLIVVFLATTVYYFTAPSEDYKRGDLVGDGVCGNIGSEEGRNECCSNAHAEDIHIQCVGGWRYISDGNRCEYVCDFNICADDVKVCDDGSVVERDSESDCEFEECP